MKTLTLVLFLAISSAQVDYYFFEGGTAESMSGTQIELGRGYYEYKNHTAMYVYVLYKSRTYKIRESGMVRTRKGESSYSNYRRTL